MIHANEIRFGNKVQTQTGDIITVQQILGSSLIYDSQIKVRREVANVRGSYNQVYSAPFFEEVKEADFSEIDPIVLTPKILAKCGFRNFVREEWILKIGNSNFDFEFTGDGLRLRHPTPSRVPIQYLHQLQNFLYAIAEYELEAEF